MGEQKTYFPSLDISPNRIKTTLRKKHTDGIWYDWEFICYGNQEMALQQILMDLQQMLMDIYYAILWGKINPDLKDVHGESIFKKSDNQDSEAKRLNIRLLEQVYTADDSAGSDLDEEDIIDYVKAKRELEDKTGIIPVHILKQCIDDKAIAFMDKLNNLVADLSYNHKGFDFVSFHEDDFKLFCSYMGVTISSNEKPGDFIQYTFLGFKLNVNRHADPKKKTYIYRPHMTGPGGRIEQAGAICNLDGIIIEYGDVDEKEKMKNFYYE